MNADRIDMLIFQPLDRKAWDRIDILVGHILTYCNVWDSPRNSDGIVWCDAIDDSSEGYRLRGRIWTIDQTLHQFWLDLNWQSLEKPEFRWSLYFEVQPSNKIPKRHMESTIEIIRTPESADWQFHFSGLAKFTHNHDPLHFAEIINVKDLPVKDAENT
jgi:hypothetical protein